MALKLITAPTAEVLSLAEAKAHLRVSGTDEDALIELWIKAARRVVEAHIGRVLISQVWDWYLDAFCPVLRPPYAPVSEVTHIKYLDSAGALTTLASSEYVADLAGDPCRITPAYGTSWPATRDQVNAVVVRIVAGYGDDGDDVPEDIRSALKLVLGHLYEHREDVAVAHGSIGAIAIPKGSEYLLAPYRTIFH